MFDPAVLGTLLIGLEPDVDQPSKRRRSRPTAQPRHSRTRLWIAGVLRRVAAAIEPRPSGTLAGESAAR